MAGGARAHVRLLVLPVVCSLAGLLGPAPASATDDPLDVGGGAIFRLQPDSRYQQGCFAPCMCPIMEQGDVRGTFELRPLAAEEGVTRYAVEDVNWTVPEGTPLRVIGAGTYSIGSPDASPAVQHRLQLDLLVGGEPVQHFDSGWVPATESKGITIAVSLNGMYCWDTALIIEAERVPDDEIYPYTLAPGSTFQRGCFDPCACPLGPELPMRGSFSLVPLMASLPLTELAVVDVRWDVLSDSTSSRIPITGFGVYQMLGDAIPQQRVALDLVVGAEPRTHFGSDAVMVSGPFPIDVVASLNGISCLDTVLHVAAHEATGGVCGGIAGLPCAEGELCELPLGQCCCDRLGACIPIPDACPTVWDPVCGCDGATYGNECEAEMSLVSVAHSGACGDSCLVADDCAAPGQYCRHAPGTCGAGGSTGECVPRPGGAPDVWDPVCGCDGVTYQNQLAADAAGISIHHSGRCPPPPPPPPRPSERRLAPRDRSLGGAGR